MQSIAFEVAMGRSIAGRILQVEAIEMSSATAPLVPLRHVLAAVGVAAIIAVVIPVLMLICKSVLIDWAYPNEEQRRVIHPVSLFIVIVHSAPGPANRVAFLAVGIGQCWLSKRPVAALAWRGAFVASLVSVPISVLVAFT